MQGVGCNLLAYCNNNPVNHRDICGNIKIGNLEDNMIFDKSAGWLMEGNLLDLTFRVEGVDIDMTFSYEIKVVGYKISDIPT